MIARKKYEEKIYFCVSKTIKEKLERIAEKEGRSLSDIIRELLAEYVNKKEQDNAKSL
jgi:predicted transcriptional regulator